MQKNLCLAFFGLFCLCLSSLTAADKRLINVEMVTGRAYWKTAQKSPYILKPGKLSYAAGLTILTIFDGQCFFSLGPEMEVRMKQDSLVVLRNNFIEIRKGTVGIAYASQEQNLSVFSPHADFEIASGTVVIKSNPALSRISIIKGSAYVVNKRQKDKLLLTAGEELAAGSGMYSKIYKQTAELRYSWYWVDPSKEPSLQSE
jgi:hypothetical protein